MNLKKISSFVLYSALTALFTISLSCSDSVSDEFEEVNGSVDKKLLQSISVISAQDATENRSIIFSYDSQDRLTSINDGVESNIIIYENGEISGAANSSGNVTVEELYASPYDAFETGDVIEYDNNGNPSKLAFFEYEYDFELQSEIQVVYTAEISYDNKPNPYYFTLDSAGIIDVLDGIRLNLSMAPQPVELIRARALFPLNNPSQIIYKNESGEIIYTLNIDYSYDGDYPVSASIIALSLIDSQTNAYSANFTYTD
ncbi:hypothetical protein [Lentiprolixibacter aurantiacus]|uniref:DUF4595 domain-containing protein n=1 Tax=Lentiprolixibacter aurantiacus TaxID=2993939 RepID=A0AAE3SMT3_9FLAO|nr:hypothetical protein [Lentiprolixibacter aurantiacus]MCX2718904.1 hypothetical protein [Lentiprolixibacter aurantiacus]